MRIRWVAGWGAGLLPTGKGALTPAVTLLLVSVSVGSAATLSGPNQTANPGESLSIALSLDSGTQPVSGVQFDLVWDPAFDVHVVPGSQAATSNKTIFTSLLQPYLLRCVIVGMNHSSVADGELVTLLIAVNPTASPGAGQLRLVNLSATAGDGTPIFLEGGTVSLQIQGGSLVPSIQPSGILSAASLASGPICPGEIITLIGSISTASPAVLLNGAPATVTYAGLNQVNAIVPFGLDLSNPAQLEIRQNGASAKATVPVAAAAPAIFTLSSTGVGPGAILNQDYTVNSVSHAAAPGSVLMVYGSGFGALTPLPADGQIAQILATPILPVTATIDDVPAQVLYAGAAPDLIEGMIQVNVVVPAGAHHNPAAPLSLSMGSFSTQPGVTVSIQ